MEAGRGLNIGSGARSAEGITSQKTNFRIERVADHEVLELGAVAVPIVLEFGQVARVVARQLRGLGLRVISVDDQVLKEREVGVEPIELVGTVSIECDGAIREDRADIAASEQVAAQSHDGEVCPGGNGFFLARLDIEKADRVPARTTRQAAAGTYGCLFSSGEADASAEKHDRCIAVLAPLEAPSGRAAEGKDSLSLEKELALFGEEQAEAREVDLLFIRFDLRKIRIDGEVRDEALRDAIFGIEADVGAESVLHRWRRGSIGR